MTHHYLESADRDPARWLAVPRACPPSHDAAGAGPDPETWAGSAARAVWRDTTETPRPGEIDALTAVLTYCAWRCPTAHPGFAVFLHLTDPRQAPLPVYVGDYAFTGDPAAELRRATAADDPGAVEPPMVTAFPTAGLGPGQRVLRYSHDHDGGLLAGLRYAWPAARPGLIACLFTVHPHPARLIAALDDLDDLARGLRYTVLVPS